MSDRIALNCGHCGKEVLLVNTSSLYKADGTPYTVYHGDCYHKMKGE